MSDKPHSQASHTDDVHATPDSASPGPEVHTPPDPGPHPPVEETPHDFVRRRMRELREAEAKKDKGSE
jgi:hypothetical protein